MYIQLAQGRSKLEDGGDLLLQGADALGVDVVSKELSGRFGQRAFVQVHRQLGMAKAGEDLLEVLLVLLDGPAAYQYIIYITEDIGNVTKHFMHYTLECATTIPKS